MRITLITTLRIILKTNGVVMADVSILFFFIFKIITPSRNNPEEISVR